MKAFPAYRRQESGFKNLYIGINNHVHLHSGINFITLYQRHYGLDKKIIENRIKVYEEAKAEHPSRWSRNIRDWSLAEASLKIQQLKKNLTYQ